MGTLRGVFLKASLGVSEELRRKLESAGRMSREPDLQYFLLGCDLLAHGPASIHVTQDVGKWLGLVVWGRGSREG